MDIRKKYYSMEFAHSFWTKPLFNNKFNDFKQSLAINLVEYALSVEYVHRAGYKITLYTDEKGKEIFSPIPYDNVVILDNYITDNYHFAASFKFIALENMKLGDVLIDGDIFLRKPKIFEIIEQDKSDILVSMFEPKSYISNTRERNIKMLNLLKPFNFEEPYETPEWKDCNGWYNTSLMKFNNDELKDEYLYQYKENLEKIQDADFEETWPDIILEQRHLTQMCKYWNFKITTIVKDFPTPKSNEYSLKVGFTHLGCAKLATQNDNVRTLYEFNPTVANNIDRHITQYLMKYDKKEEE